MIKLFSTLVQTYMEKVLITGGAGFIGSHTADLLLSMGIPVRVLDNLSSGYRENLPKDDPNFEFIEGDIRDSKTVDRCMQGISHCLHLAAQVSVVASLEDPEFSAQQNIVGFINVLDAGRRHNIYRMVYASSAAVYGTPTEIPLPEYAEKSQLSPYGLEKQVNEQYAQLYNTLYGISSLGQRYFNVYGPRQDPKSPYAGVIALFVDRIALSKPLTIYGDGNQTRDFIYVGDVAAANVAALKSDYQGASNIATGKQTSLLGLTEVLGKITGNTPELAFDAPREGDIVHSLAVTEVMNNALGVTAKIQLEKGLRQLIDYST